MLAFPSPILHGSVSSPPTLPSFPRLFVRPIDDADDDRRLRSRPASKTSRPARNVSYIIHYYVSASSRNSAVCPLPQPQLPAPSLCSCPTPILSLPARPLHTRFLPKLQLRSAGNVWQVSASSSRRDARSRPCATASRWHRLAFLFWRAPAYASVRQRGHDSGRVGQDLAPCLEAQSPACQRCDGPGAVPHSSYERAVPCYHRPTITIHILRLPASVLAPNRSPRSCHLHLLGDTSVESPASMRAPVLATCPRLFLCCFCCFCACAPDSRAAASHCPTVRRSCACQCSWY